MLIYNQTTNAFIRRVRLYLKELVAELGFDYGTTRVKINNMTYPLNLVVFEGDQRLGFYDHHSFRLGLNLKLIYLANSDVLRDIIKHELAHFLTAIFYPAAHAPHGPEFLAICSRFKLPDYVAAARVNLDQANELQLDQRSEKVLRQVKKLLALAASNNQHEAEMATSKANQLLLRHNLELIDLRQEERNQEEDTFVHQVLTAKRQSAKLHAIYQILTTFYVYPVFHQGRGEVRLEVIGNRPSVELAEYVADFLDRHLEELWTIEQKRNPKLKGAVAKNSFFRGVASGHCQRINQLQQASSKELVVLQQNLERCVEQVYSRLGSSHSRSSFCPHSHALGKSAGEKLSIIPGVKHESATKKLLSFFKK